MKCRPLIDSLEAERDKQVTEREYDREQQKGNNKRKRAERADRHFYHTIWYIEYIIANGYKHCSLHGWPGRNILLIEQVL